jgi:predicted TIM-barrel fold metal-dependent hydrolase
MGNVATGKVVVVSADGHCGPPVEEYRSYLDPKYHGALDQLIDEEREYTTATSKIGSFSATQLGVIDRAGAIASGGLTGAWDVDRRIVEMDREGIAAELLLAGHQLASTPFFGIGNNVYPPDVRMAGARAFNRWQADVISAGGDRFIGIVEHAPVSDIGELVREIEWAAEHGFRGIVMPGAIADKSLPRPPFYSPYWEPFWAACAAADLAMVLHVGLGPEQGVVFDLFRARAATMTGDYRRDVPEPSQSLMDNSAATPKKDDIFALNYSPRQVLWELMVGGVFDRYPNLRYVPTEARADWLPDTLAHMDARFERGDTPLRKRPSEYWQSNGFAGASFIHRAELEDRERIGVSTLMFGRDYPHPEGTWPNSIDWIRAAFAGVPDSDARKVLGENAIRCYGLDGSALAAVAARIGPDIDDLLGRSEDVDPLIVDEFDKRGGFRKAAPGLETQALDSILDSALVGASSR